MSQSTYEYEKQIHHNPALDDLDRIVQLEQDLLDAKAKASCVPDLIRDVAHFKHRADVAERLAARLAEQVRDSKIMAAIAGETMGPITSLAYRAFFAVVGWPGRAWKRWRR